MKKVLTTLRAIKNRGASLSEAPFAAVDSKTELVMNSTIQYLATQTSNENAKFLQTKTVEDFMRTENKLVLPFLVISPFGAFKKLWSILVVVCLLYTSWILPYRVAFEKEFSPNVVAVFLTIDMIIDFILIADIVVNSLSAYENQEGVLIINKLEIISNYGKFWLWIDLLSCFPYYFFTQRVYLEIINKAFKIIRLPKLLKKLALKDFISLKSVPLYGPLHKKLMRFLVYVQHNLGLSLIKIMYWFFFAIHLATCSWHYAIQFEKPGEEAFNWVEASHLTDSDKEIKYVASLFFVLTVMITIGYGSITPTTFLEKVLSIFMMFFGILIYGKLMGSLLDLSGKVRSRLAEYQDRSDLLDVFARKARFSKHFYLRALQGLLGDHDLNRRAGLIEDYVHNGLFQNIQEGILWEVCVYLFREELAKFEFFDEKPQSFVAKILLAIQTLRFREGDVIYTEGENPAFVYFIVKGEISARFLSREGEQVSSLLREGSYFGEIEVLLHERRQNTRTVLSDSVLWRVGGAELLGILSEFPEIETEMKALALEKKKAWACKRTRQQELPSHFPMNYWRWHHEGNTWMRPFLERILYKKSGAEDFLGLGQTYFSEKEKLLRKESEALEFRRQYGEVLLEINEMAIDKRACRRLEDQFLFRFFDEELGLLGKVGELIGETRDRLADWERIKENVDSAVGESVRVLEDLKELKHLAGRNGITA